MASITISYDLNPPAGVDAGGLKKNKTLEFPVQVQVDGHQKDVQPNAHAIYYGHLRTAIAAARQELGEELTRWRDAVGKEEMGEGAREEEGEGEEEAEQEG
ncbi:hypothetical protein C8J56DRAFT_31698 [Mycena floridula]|nr:hypothetical protein C8J56DRAFT_31698 [Mycena floridula]